jgi:hypothetical protein
MFRFSKSGCFDPASPIFLLSVPWSNPVCRRLAKLLTGKLGYVSVSPNIYEEH